MVEVGLHPALSRPRYDGQWFRKWFRADSGIYTNILIRVPLSDINGFNVEESESEGGRGCVTDGQNYLIMAGQA